MLDNERLTLYTSEKLNDIHWFKDDFTLKVNWV
jgi:hypothetical protein